MTTTDLMTRPLGHLLRTLDADMPGGWNPATAATGFRVDIEETDKAYLICAEMPGIVKDDVQLNIEDNVLSICAKFGKDAEGGDARRLHSERVSGSFSRSFRLPRDVNSGKIAAQMKDGLLHLNLPKSGDAMRRNIRIS